MRRCKWIVGAQKNLIAIGRHQLLLVIDGLSAPHIHAAFDHGRNQAFIFSTAVEVEQQAETVTVIHDLFHIGNQHFPAGIQGKERSALGAPVIVEKYGVDMITGSEFVQQFFVKVNQRLEELFDVLLLILVDQGHGGGFKIQEGNQALEHAVENPYRYQLVGVQKFSVFLRAFFPVPLIDIRKHYFFLPLRNIFQKGLSGFHHGTARYGYVFPLNSENIRAAHGTVIGLTIHYKGSGYIVRIDAG